MTGKTNRMPSAIAVLQDPRCRERFSAVFDFFWQGHPGSGGGGGDDDARSAAGKVEIASPSGGARAHLRPNAVRPRTYTTSRVPTSIACRTHRD